MQSIQYYYHNPKVVKNILLLYLGGWLPDPFFLKLKFRIWQGYYPDLRHPKTFSEKIQWLKLYNRHPEYTMLVDKIEVKKIVASIIGEKHIIPTIGVWSSPDLIDFNALPNRFVLKCNHNSGRGMYICKDKTKLNTKEIRRGLRQGLRENYYLASREWPYKNVHRKILAEEYIDSGTSDLPDYKWYCFNGVPKYCQVIQNRNTDETIDFFDSEWHPQDFIGLTQGVHHATVIPRCPKYLSTHLEIARKLSQGIPFVRIDLYETDSQVYFGEITFFPGSGFGSFSPNEYNYILGDMIQLPNIG